MPLESLQETSWREERQNSKWKRRRDIPIAILAWIAVVAIILWAAGHVIRSLLLLAIASLLAFALAPFADGRIEQTVGTVHALAESADLRADIAVGDRILVRSVDRDHLAVLHRDGEAARVGTVERARRLDDGCGTSQDRVARRTIVFCRGHRHAATIAFS